MERSGWLSDRGGLRGRARRGPRRADALHDGRLPRPATSLAVAAAYADAGADLIELGVPVLRPARRRADDPRRRDRGAGRRRHARRRAGGLRVDLGAGAGRPDGLRQHGPGARRRRRVRAPRGRRRRSRGDRPRPAARGGRGDPRGLRRRRPGARPAGRADHAGRAPRADLRRRRRASSTSSPPSAPPASATRFPPASPIWSPRPRPRPRCRSRSASGSAPPSRPPEVGGIADGVIIGSRLVRAVGEAGVAARRPPRPSRAFLRETRVALALGRIRAAWDWS